MKTEIIWTKQADQSFEGSDDNGNAYWMSANREWVTVETPEGRKGHGWTAEAALLSAYAD